MKKSEVRKIIKRSVLLFLPVLVPSWRFFDGIAASPRIEFRVDGTEGWHALCVKETHIPFGQRISHLFHNPKINDDLFMASCAERIKDGQIAHSEAEIAKRISQKLEQGAAFRFRIVFVNEDDCGVLQRKIGYESDVLRVTV